MEADVQDKLKSGPAAQQSPVNKNKQHLEGKALQVNENSVEDADTVSPTQMPDEQANQKHVGGKALRVNENSVD